MMQHKADEGVYDRRHTAVGGADAAEGALVCGDSVTT